MIGKKVHYFGLFELFIVLDCTTLVVFYALSLSLSPTPYAMMKYAWNGEVFGGKNNPARMPELYSFWKRYAW